MDKLKMGVKWFFPVLFLAEAYYSLYILWRIGKTQMEIELFPPKIGFYMALFTAAGMFVQPVIAAVKGDGEFLLKSAVFVKALMIPWFLLNFAIWAVYAGAIGAVLSLFAGLFGPLVAFGIICVACVYTYGFLIIPSITPICYAASEMRRQRMGKAEGIVHMALQLFFVLDIVDLAVLVLRKKTRKGEEI